MLNFRPLTQPAAPKTIGRSNIVTPHSQLARLANFDVLETVVRQEKRRKQVTSPHLQTSGYVRLSFYSLLCTVGTQINVNLYCFI